jgi:methyl-accepting chemotaxis protein
LTVAAGSSDVKELAAEMKSNAVALELLLNNFTFRPAVFDIGKIKNAHFNWKMRLTAVLRGYTTITSEKIPNHHQCDFGKWYDTASAIIKNHPLFQEIGSHHEAVHVKVVQAVDLFNSNRSDEAMKKVEEFEEVRKKLFDRLDEMYIS